MKYAKNVAVFGFNEEQMQAIEDALPRKDTEVLKIEYATDLIAFDHLAVLVNARALRKKDYLMLLDFYEQVEYFAGAVIMTNIPAKFPKPMVRFMVYPDFEALRPNLAYVLMSAYRSKRKSENFSNRLANAVSILGSIRKEPGISTKELAERLELSPRTVQRYIETLRVAGEFIAYDIKLKGWKLEMGKSVLFDEI